MKKHLNTSGEKSLLTSLSKREEFPSLVKRGKGRFYKRISLPHNLINIWSFILLLFIVSCAPKYVEKPSHDGISLDNAISEYRNISSIEAVLSVEYEKNDSVMSGDAFLNLSDNKMNLRLYYLGFLAGEVTEENGIIKSKPKFDKNKSIILVDGLKNSFFWWNIKDYTMHEKEGMYFLKNYNRKILISKETLLPVLQTIELDNGEEMSISYDEPVRYGVKKEEMENEKSENPPPVTSHSSLPLWYQSRLSIKYRNYIVRVKVKSYSVEKQKEDSKKT